MANFRICIQNLALYNEGRHLFQWVDLPLPESELTEICHTIARAPRNGDGEVTAEGDEIIVVDVEGFPFKAESGSPQRFNEWVEALEDHGEPLAAYIENLHLSPSDDPNAVITDFADAYEGEYASEADHAEETCRYCANIPHPLENYIDWEAVARDFRLGGDYYYLPAGGRAVYAFRNV